MSAGRVRVVALVLVIAFCVALVWVVAAHAWETDTTTTTTTTTTAATTTTTVPTVVKHPPVTEAPAVAQLTETHQASPVPVGPSFTG